MPAPRRRAWPSVVLGALLAAFGSGPAAALRTRARGPGEAEADAVAVPVVVAAMPGFHRRGVPTGRNSELSPASAELLRFRGSEEGQQQSQLESHQSAEVVLHALRDPWWVGNKHLQLVTVETRPNKTKIHRIENVGFLRRWTGYITKLRIMNEWLANHTDDKAQIIFIDGEDTLYGGCSEEQFMTDYQEIVKRSRDTEVVVGAERGCYDCPKPWRCDTVPQVPAWAYRNWTLAGGGKTIRGSLLDPSGQMRFVNSGFITGPVDQLRALFRKSLASMMAWKKRRLPTDQYFVAEYVLQHPRSAVLDYASSLVTSGYSLNATKLFALTGEGGLYNLVTGKQQCFFHANGASRFTIDGLIAWQQGGPKPW
mmetsp:Transcript_144483/g.402514  ORF Transcript_144483/g.402514 Transcript_144483/m.402514 type:complete len:368 (-) Transcript_144483:116-1219(-)